MRARRPAALALALASATVLAGLSGPAQSAPTVPAGAVKGLHQAYQASTYKGPRQLPEAAQTEATFFLADGADGGSLATSRPAGVLGATQRTHRDGDEDRVGDPLVAAWRTPMTRTVRGALELTWWWSSPTATLNDEVVAVAVIADPGTSRERVIGRAELEVNAGAEPVRNVHRVFVDGDVEDSLLLQTRPIATSDSAELDVHYDSATTPSAVAYKAAAAGFPRKQQNTPARYAGPRLEVQATYIGRDAAEPTVGIDKEGVAFMAAGAFDALGVDGGLARTEIKRSKDGGKSWETVQFTLPADLTTVPPTTLDPYVYLDEDTGRVFTPDLYLACNYLQFSDDQGETWTQSPVACGQPGLNDHQTIVTGPPPEGEQSLGIYPNYVYYCFNRVADASCGRSLDGGLTWLPAGAPAFIEPAQAGSPPRVCGSLHGHIITDNQGRLYLPKGHCGFPWLAISEDGAQTWRRVQVNDKFGSAGTHLSVDVDEAGTIYYLWWTAADRVPLLSHSVDGGDTWSEPVLVAPPGVQEVNFPTIDAGKAGQVAITFPGTLVDREDPSAEAAGRPWNYYVLTSLNADSPSPLFVSTTAQPTKDPIHRGNCGPGRCAGMFDFIDVEFAPSGEIWAAAADTCTEESNCNTPDGSSAPSAAGVAIRQLSGPGLSAPVAAPAPVAPRPAPPRAPAPLPATGASAVLLWAALLTMCAAVATSRLRDQRSR